MPVDFLSPAQQENYGKYPNDLTPEFIANYFFLDDKDKEWIKSKRGKFSRLGYALQLITVRYIGTFYSDLTTIPWKIIERIAAQVHVDDISNYLSHYQQSEQRWRHATEIRIRYGYKEFNEKSIQFKLGRWLYALFWTGTDRPGLLFEQAVSWLLTNKVLLPGITTVERFIAEIRSRMDARLWRSLIKNLTDDQTSKLNKLLLVEDNQPQSLLDTLRKGPVRASSKTLVKALKRLEHARNLSIQLPVNTPPGRIAVLSRFANTAKITAISRLSYEIKMATLVAFAHHFESAAQDDVLDILSIVLSELFGKAKRINQKKRLRTLKDLDAAAAILIDACKVVLDGNLIDQEVREKIFNTIGLESLVAAFSEADALIQPPDDIFYRELENKEQTVKNFLPAMLRVMNFDGNEAGKPVIQALSWLKSKSKKEAPMIIVNKTWKRYVLDKDNQLNKVAYTFCVLDKLQGALKRRDIFVSPSFRYSDPRANLHTGEEWDVIRPTICRSLNLSLEPYPYLQEIVTELDETYKLVASNFDRDETIRASNAVIVAAQNQNKLAKKWGGGDLASADGMRFVVPVRSIHSAPNPKYFNQRRGVTWYNLLSNQRTGLNHVTVPGTLRDSLILLGVVLEQQTELQPTRIMTDTGAYSDVVFGLFRLLGHRFSPRLADLGDARFWRIDPLADYGKLNTLAKHRINLERVAPHWDDVLRLVGLEECKQQVL